MTGTQNGTENGAGPVTDQHLAYCNEDVNHPQRQFG